MESQSLKKMFSKATTYQRVTFEFTNEIEHFYQRLKPANLTKSRDNRKPLKTFFFDTATHYQRSTFWSNQAISAPRLKLPNRAKSNRQLGDPPPGERVVRERVTSGITSSVINETGSPRAEAQETLGTSPPAR